MNAKQINTHGVRINYGKHKGTLVTRLPVSYLRWMINNNAPMVEYAVAELARRGDILPTAEISGHAMDRTSLRVARIWKDNRYEDEGLYTWLMRITLEALTYGEKVSDDTYLYLGMKLVIVQGEEFPVLLTIMK